MDGKQQDSKMSPSVRSTQGEPSASKKTTSLTLFEDLLDNPNADNLHLDANTLRAHRVKDSSTSNSQNGARPVKGKSLTLFEDLLENNPETENLPAENESSPSGHHQNGASAANERIRWSSFGFNVISDDDIVYQSIKRHLESSLNSGGFDVQLEGVYRNDHSSTMGRAKFQAFSTYSEAMKEKCGGNADVNCAWYGASRNQIEGILSYGFTLPMNNAMFGHGFYFSAVPHAIRSLRFSMADADGLRHLLLCRVILGKVEVVSSGSRQQIPSSEEFDSGVDELEHPRMFIIWNAKVNTHVLPEFVVSFRTSPSCSGSQRNPRNTKPPNSDWIPVANLVNGLSNIVPESARRLLAKHLIDYEMRKISRHAMIQRIRYIVGDRLLRAMIRTFGEKVNASGRSIQAPK